MTSQWFTGQVFVKDTYLQYYRTGGEKPTLVLLHGFTDSALCWTPIAKALEAQYDVLMLDTRCHGKSVSPAIDFTVTQLVIDVITVLDALNLKQIALLGHSMGAFIGACVAVERPDLVKTLLLEDPPWRNSGTPIKREQHENFIRGWQESMEKNKAIPIEEALKAARQANPRWSDDEHIPWIQAQRDFNMEVMQGPFFGEALNEWQKIITDITVPTLLITGNPQLGAATNEETAQQAVSTWMDGQIINIADAGHCIRRDQYAAFLDAIQSFLYQKYLQSEKK